MTGHRYGHAPEAAEARERERLVLAATERIGEAMEEADVSQAELARLLGTSRANVSALLGGGRNMTLHTLADLAFALRKRVIVGLEPLPVQDTPRNVEIPRERIARFCRRHRIRRLALFGSVLRDDFGPGSDVDVLVEFEEGHTPGLAFFTLHEELAEIFGRPVDLHTFRAVEQSRNPLRRRAILDSLRTVYAA